MYYRVKFAVDISNKLPNFQTHILMKINNKTKIWPYECEKTIRILEDIFLQYSLISAIIIYQRKYILIKFVE